MKEYNTEMDGFSLVEANRDLKKDELVLLHGNFESSFYKVNNVDDKNISFKLFKYTELANDETSFEYNLNGKIISFVNRPSKNQSIYDGETIYKVLDIEKETKTLIVEVLSFEEVKAVYAVYKTGISNKREEVARFHNWGEAYGCVVSNRSKGNQLFL